MQDGRSNLKSKLSTLVDFTNIEPSSTNNIATRELAITGALKFENCKFAVTAAKKNKLVHVPFFFVNRLKIN
jgi:hypothetical protein